MVKIPKITTIIWLFTFISCSVQFVFRVRESPSLNSLCQVARTNSTGQCKFIEDCPIIYKEIKNDGLFPQLCGFVDKKELICCPKKLEALKVDVRISQKKCHEYSEFNALPIPDIKFSTSLERGRNACEEATHDAFEAYLISQKNNNVSLNDVPGLMTYPHMALLGYDSFKEPGGIDWACGGSLISNKFILTASHCLNTQAGPVKYVLLGELDSSTNDDLASPMLFTVAERISHPKYSKRKAKNDIALLVLNQTVIFDAFMSPACLHDSYDVDASKAIATGWGENVNHTRDPHLQEVDLDLIETSYCQKEFKKLDPNGVRSDLDDESQVCAGSLSDGKDTCHGDSGGPLQMYHPTLRCMFSIIGVTSFGWPVCGRMKPGVYTRVFYYLDWIESVVWPTTSS